jgi:hypothetical protein
LFAILHIQLTVFGANRLSSRNKEMARFCRRLARMMGVQLQAGLGLSRALDLSPSWDTFRANLKRDGLTCELRVAQEPGAVIAPGLCGLSTRQGRQAPAAVDQPVVAS